MPQFRVNAYVTVSCWTVVEADTYEEAIKKAGARELAHAHIDLNEPEDQAWHIDLDGSPTDLFIDSE